VWRSDNSWRYSDSNWDPTVVQSVASRCIDYAAADHAVALFITSPSGTRDQFFFLLEISSRQLRVCYFVAPSLTIGRVCNLLYSCFWALPEQSLLGRSPAELTAIFYCLIWDFPNLEGQVPVFISPPPRNKVAQLYPPGHWVPFFVASYDSQVFCFRWLFYKYFWRRFSLLFSTCAHFALIHQTKCKPLSTEFNKIPSISTGDVTRGVIGAID
jgi:hypothetical protein